MGLLWRADGSIERSAAVRRVSWPTQPDALGLTALIAYGLSHHCHWEWDYLLNIRYLSHYYFELHKLPWRFYKYTTTHRHFSALNYFVLSVSNLTNTHTYPGQTNAFQSQQQKEPGRPSSQWKHVLLLWQNENTVSALTLIRRRVKYEGVSPTSTNTLNKISRESLFCTEPLLLVNPRFQISQPWNPTHLVPSAFQLTL